MANRDGAGRRLYAISVVAELVGTGQQNIRLYERRGLLTPERTDGGTRQYSESDLAVLRRIAELLDEGLNLAGVAKVLELEMDNARLRRQLQRARGRGASPGDGGSPQDSARAGHNDGDRPAEPTSEDVGT
ncbi:putative MerR family transcriptional regulator [Arthrobacter globiformis NBRC 12137]|uniref:Putative MerR family transcriptional regulator n=1 Tax=Arthrobacter globiformis (strain ATCC 8010 / DSM 20124 / JCM 1332 / NBRC 12137 / NCIMB 8907 / NRRL B-2979 / 168) TaxID=1077972 RepID=H0QU71_ARTG1|nr:putative MerR family transcriptional regulator [Arthrobacter globiformis NBRC 12137]